MTYACTLTSMYCFKRQSGTAFNKNKTKPETDNNNETKNGCKCFVEKPIKLNILDESVE